MRIGDLFGSKFTKHIQRNIAFKIVSEKDTWN